MIARDEAQGARSEATLAYIKDMPRLQAPRNARAYKRRLINLKKAVSSLEPAEDASASVFSF